MKVRKLAWTLAFWQSVGTVTVDGQKMQVGMDVGGRSVFLIVPNEAWYVVDIQEIVKELVAYREAHKTDPPEDEPQEKVDAGSPVEGSKA